MKISLKKKSWDRKGSTKSKAINCKPLVKLNNSFSVAKPHVWSSIF